MPPASFTVLGCGSALPTRQHFPASYLLEMRDKQFLIDCGEGTQIRMRQMALRTSRLGHIFISHLHGDHCFGLTGLISSFAMLGRTADLHLHAPQSLEGLLAPLLQFFCSDRAFQVFFHPFDTRRSAPIYDDKSLTVTTIPLAHRVPCCGFLFEEKPRERNIRREMIDFYQIPVAQIAKIKQGADFIAPEGDVIDCQILTTAPPPPKRFAYCSDTAYCEKIVPLIRDVDLLFHEATFASSEVLRARETCHSTAAQAASIARRANAKQLIVGHFSARYCDSLSALADETQAIFPNTILARDGMRVEF